MPRKTSATSKALTVLATVSALLCLTAIAGCVRGSLTQDLFFWSNGDHLTEVWTHKDVVYIEAYDGWPTTEHFQWKSGEEPLGPRTLSYQDQPGVVRVYLDAAGKVAMPDSSPPFHVSDLVNRRTVAIFYFSNTILLSGLLPLGVFGLRAARWRKAKLRARAGLCPTCGYDLRATPDLCPECGTIPGR